MNQGSAKLASLSPLVITVIVIIKAWIGYESIPKKPTTPSHNTLYGVPVDENIFMVHGPWSMSLIFLREPIASHLLRPTKVKNTIKRDHRNATNTSDLIDSFLIKIR